MLLCCDSYAGEFLVHTYQSHTLSFSFKPENKLYNKNKNFSDSFGRDINIFFFFYVLVYQTLYFLTQCKIVKSKRGESRRYVIEV